MAVTFGLSQIREGSPIFYVDKYRNGEWEDSTPLFEEEVVDLAYDMLKQVSLAKVMRRKQHG